jgi:hypothetical protein
VSGKTVQVRVLAGDWGTWAQRGITTAADVRAAVILGILHPERLNPEKSWERSGMVSWHVRFSPAEIELIDAARGDVPRSRWISEIVDRMTCTAEEIAAQEMLEQLGGEKV